MTIPEIVKIQSKWLKDAIKRIRELESENKDLKLQVAGLQAELITSRNYYERRLQDENRTHKRQCSSNTLPRRRII